eukprot:TRINITY_DN21405_c0_g1_i1.p1 TRINITY_DN21405_c0_g1~~TRINITY_DN21405_c0_g1_i1.p1  ORF type:complete len:239 (+),score=63.41 TRINITY_DN21405_c0_g1_i1:66-719(+)
MTSIQQSHNSSQKASKRSTKHPCRKDRFRATVIQIGETPKLRLENGGEFFFAYRSVKKRPGEQRQILVVGDIVDCRLTKTVPAKAVSIKIVVKLPQPEPKKELVSKDVYQHDPYAVPNLMEELGGGDAVDDLVDSYLDSLLPCKSPPTHKHKKLMTIGDDFPTDIIFLGENQPPSFNLEEENTYGSCTIPEAPSCVAPVFDPFVERKRSTSCPPIGC